MKSRITIEVDFENHNQPTIQIVRKESDDVRDNLVAFFIQSLGGESFCEIKCIADHRPNHVWDSESFQKWRITPLKQPDISRALNSDCTGHPHSKNS